MSAPIVTKFGAYEILLELKSGGMGDVLLGRRRGPGSFEQLVAIKTIRPEFAGTPAVRAMFLDEAAILARLNHPGVATVHDFGDEGGALYMVMEYVAGIPFRDLMEPRSPATVVARAVAEACRGLHAAHEIRNLQGDLMGVVHRDISPDNLMLGYDGHVKVIDFGIALVKNRQAPVTEFGTVKGKPPYMSPEQVKNEAMDRRSDVFSLAVVLHELLTGVRLFDGDSIYAIARALEHQEIKPPSAIAGPLPRGLDDVVMRALERDLDRRTPTAAAFAEQLEQVLQTAGDETLEAWADRELMRSREEHRAWIASVVAGRDRTGPGIGRPTGMLTALSGAATMPLVAGPATEEDDEIEPGVSTHLAATTDHDTPVRRRGIAPWLAMIVALAAIGGGSYVFLHNHATSAPADAGVDGRVVLPADAARDAAQRDATPSDAAPSDANEPIDAPIDAGHHHTVVIDARAHDAPSPIEIDAAPPPPVGSGFLTIGGGDGYFNVVIDGNPAGATPIFNQPIAAGPHKIDLLDGATGKLVISKTVTVTDHNTVTVRP